MSFWAIEHTSKVDHLIISAMLCVSRASSDIENVFRGGGGGGTRGRAGGVCLMKPVMGKVRIALNLVILLVSSVV